MFEVGESTPVSVGQPIVVRSRLLQLQLLQHLVVSSVAGGQFTILELTDATVRIQNQSQLLVFDLVLQTVNVLPHGDWTISQLETGIQIVAMGDFGERIVDRQSFHFDDYVYARQSELVASYEAKQKEALQTLNQGIASLLNALSGGKKK